MALVIGVDPGLAGAIALVDSYGVLVDVIDMPVVGNLVSASLIRDFLADINWCYSGQSTAVIEDVHSMPKQGVTSSFGFGRSKGLVEGLFAGLRHPIVYVSPARWKKAMGVTADKETCRRRALDLWPQHSAKFKFKKNADRAEAALIALWFIQHGEGRSA